MIKIAIACLLLAACTKSPNSNTTTDVTPALVPLPSNTLNLCRQDLETCASVNIDLPEAKEAYQLGCDGNQYYSCFRLGQFYEIKALNPPEALKAYEKSCSGKDSYGCENETALRSKLCFLEKKKEFCKGEPKGEYRILLFLETLDAKYQDAFMDHHFSEPFTLEPTLALYKKRLAERNKKLLAVLRNVRKQGKQDGQNAENLQDAIWELEGKENLIDDHEH